MELLVVTYKTLVVTYHSYSCVISTTHTEWRQTFKCQTSLIVFTLLHLYSQVTNYLNVYNSPSLCSVNKMATPPQNTIWNSAVLKWISTYYRYNIFTNSSVSFHVSNHRQTLWSTHSKLPPSGSVLLSVCPHRAAVAGWERGAHAPLPNFL